MADGDGHATCLPAAWKGLWPGEEKLVVRPMLDRVASE